MLVAEDEAAVRELLARMLRDEGYDVLEASHGGEALALLEERGDGVVLLLTDLVMPVLGGSALARRVNERRPGLPLILMSGHARDGGADDPRDQPWPFLQKPIVREALIDAVRHALDVRAG